MKDISNSAKNKRVQRQGRVRRASLGAFFMALALIAGFAGFGVRAQTGQGQVGPINPDTGFPFWYQDANGLRLELCLDNNPICLSTLPDQSRPALVAAQEADSNFPDEAFWWTGGAQLAADNGVVGELVLASEAAFVNGVKQGEQISFGRIRIRIDHLEDGATYRIVHPYGADVFDNVTAGERGINFTEDIGIDQFPQGFLNSRIKPFLTWDTFGIPAEQIPAGDIAPPAGFIGDPTVEHKVKGSPIIDATGKPQNYFRIEKLDPVSRQVIEVVGQTDLFVVSGKLAGLAVLASPRGGAYAATQSVSLVSSDPQAMVFYTTDSSDPVDMANPARTQYTAPISIAADTTLKFYALDGAGRQSTVMTETYTFGGGEPNEPPTGQGARLTKTGPVDPNTGFPMWYEDANGMRLDLCLDNNPLCLSTLPDTTRPGVVADEAADSNFPDEAFWWTGEAELAGADGIEGELVLAAEAAFSNTVQTGQQMAFGRVRIRIDNLVQGATYRVIHPYGRDEFDNVSGGDRGINFTEDIGTTSFPNGILNSRIGPFLTWDTFGVPAGQLQAGQTAPPAGYVGDPAVAHRVKGSPLNQNYFRIERLDPVTREVIQVIGQTDLFNISGKVSTLKAVASPRSGAYRAGQAVTLTPSDTTAVTYYTMATTTDGSTPVDPSDPSDPANTGRVQYTEPIALPTATNSKVVLKFATVITNATTGVTQTSPVVTESYTLDSTVPTVAANPPGGMFLSAPSVSLTASEAATIFYTTDGTNPTDPANTSRLRFTVPIVVRRDMTLKFLARDAAGNTSPIVTEVYLIDSEPPAAPSVPDMTDASDNGTSTTDNVTTDTTPTFNGTAEAGATVKIFVDGIERGNGVASSTGTYSITTVTLEPGTHTVTAQAIDAANNASVLSGTLTITINAATAPVAPSNLTARIGSSNERVNLTWRDNSTVENGVQIERSTSPTSGFIRIATVGINVTAFTDTAAPRKRTLYYRVRAINSVGASAYSNTASVTTN
jgi:hypothetical protein